MPKFEKLADQHYKLISSEGGQDTSTSAYKISGHSLQEMTRNPKFNLFH